jgi:TM2 domain-containing membrane protein YozV/Tfp pilus assembly protein PilE
LEIQAVPSPVLQSPNSANPPSRKIGPYQKFCSSCAEVIPKNVFLCPKCGGRQGPGLSKVALVLLTFFLGGIGAHKFYTGQTKQGVVYLLLCWSGIPRIISIVEFFIYAFTKEEALQNKFPSYKGTSSVVVLVVCVFGGIFLLGMLAAIAIPTYVGYLQKARVVVVSQTLDAVYNGEKRYYSAHKTYTDNLASLEVTLPQHTWFALTIDNVSPTTFTAHAAANRTVYPAAVGDELTIDQDGKKGASGGMAKVAPEWR